MGKIGKSRKPLDRRDIVEIVAPFMKEESNLIDVGEADTLIRVGVRECLEVRLEGNDQAVRQIRCGNE